MTISAQQETVFSNNQLSVEEIPSLQTLALLPISKKYRTLNILSIGLIALVLIGIASALRFQSFWSLPEGLLQASLPVCCCWYRRCRLSMGAVPLFC